MNIRNATENDLEGLLAVEEEAFGPVEGPEIAVLVRSLLADPTARPLFSLVALNGRQVLGHILFTKARVEAKEEVTAAILAPLAVLPGSQNRGIGGRLIAAGLKQLSEAGVKLVFVLGHPDYYPRHGFKPAGALGFEAPYPIPEEVAAAWMVQELVPGFIGRVRGRVLCCAALDRPEYWRE